jgi:GTPase SAR1 family protein
MNQYLFWEWVKDNFECLKIKKAARKAARERRRAMKKREAEKHRKNVLAREKKQWKLVPRKEVDQLIKEIKLNPEKFIFVYGPPMSGKTYLMEQLFTKIQREKRVVKVLKTIFGKCEKKAPAFHPKYINFRSFIVNSIADLELALVKAPLPFGEEEVKRIKESGNLFFGLEQELKRIYKEKGTKVLLIVEELQLLDGVPTPAKKNMLDAFLHFLIRIGTETDFARVVISAPYKFFITRFYEDSLFRQRGEFFKVDHLTYEEMKSLILFYYPDTEELVIKKVWDVLGGSFPDLWKFIMRGWHVKIEEKGIKGWLAKRIQEKEEAIPLSAAEEYLEKEIRKAATEVKKVVLERLTEEDIPIFITMVEDILKRGSYKLSLEKRHQLGIARKLAEESIFFFDPIEMNVKGSKRLYEKGLERVYKSL